MASRKIGNKASKSSIWVFYDNLNRGLKFYCGEGYWAEAELPDYILEEWFLGKMYNLVGCYNIAESKEDSFEDLIAYLRGKPIDCVKSCLDDFVRDEEL